MGTRKLKAEVQTVYYDDEDGLISNKDVYDLFRMTDDFFWSNESWCSMIKRNIAARLEESLCTMTHVAAAIYAGRDVQSPSAHTSFPYAKTKENSPNR